MDGLNLDQIDLLQEIKKELEPCKDCNSKIHVVKLIYGKPSRDIKEIEINTGAVRIEGGDPVEGINFMCENCNKKF